MKKSFLALIVVMILSLASACGDVENTTAGNRDAFTPPPPAPAESPDSPEEPEESPEEGNPAEPDLSEDAAPYTKTLSSDAAITEGNTAVIFNSNWADPIGNIAAIGLANPTTAALALNTTDGSDAIVRSFGGRIYVVNRFGADSIQVIDPKTWNVIANYSTGNGSNPQDIVVVSDSKAYISRLDAQNDVNNSDDIIIVNPLTGASLGSIDLTPYTTDDGDRFARAAQMVLVDDRLYVCMQDLPGNMLLSADTNGKIAVIDTVTDELLDVDLAIPGVQVIGLSGRNPSDITYSPLTDKLYVADTGVYVNWVVNTADDNGGIEIIDAKTNQTEGIVIDDADLGGGVAELRIASAGLGFTIIGSTTVAAFNPTTYAIVDANVYQTPGFFLPDISIDLNGRLLIAEQDFNGPGIVFVNPADGVVIAGPTSVGAPPSSIAFVDVTS